MSLSLMQKQREQKFKAQQTSQLEARFPVRAHLAAFWFCVAGQLCKHLATPGESHGDPHSREGARLWCQVQTHRPRPMAFTERHHKGNLAWKLWLNLEAFWRSHVMNPTPAMKLQCPPLALQEYSFVSRPMQPVFLGGLCQIPTLTPVCTVLCLAALHSSVHGKLFSCTTQLAV